MSDILNVPILKAGNHHSRNKGVLSVSDEMLESIFEGSKACKDVIKESIETGFYRGNDIQLSRPIPGALNLHHDDILDETIKERVKSVDWNFGTEEIDGETWLTQTFHDVPEDIAKAIKTHYSGRSVELLPLTHPDTGVKYPMVVRSTAFLDRNTQPAVKGQSHDIQVEFAEGGSPVTVLYSTNFETSSNMEDIIMDDTKQKTPDNSGQEVAELTGKLSVKDAEIAELQAKVAENDAHAAKIAELEAARKADSDRIAELQAAQDVAESANMVNALKTGRVKGSEGFEYQTSPAFIELAAPLITGTAKGDIIELAEGKEPARDVIVKALQGIVELAANGGLVVCMSEVADMAHKEPGAKPQNVTERAKALAKDEDIPFAKALLRVKQEG